VTDRVGSVECGDYTRGHKPPMTVSRIGTGETSWTAWWGRQNVAVYIVAVLAFLMVVATAYYLHWYRLAFAASPGPIGGLITIAIMLGIPFFAGSIASMAGLDVRSFPRLVDLLIMLVPAAAIGSYGVIRGERGVPRQGVGGGCWLLPLPGQRPTAAESEPAPAPRVRRRRSTLHLAALLLLNVLEAAAIIFCVVKVF
jgi:hypothetical protein